MYRIKKNCMTVPKGSHAVFFIVGCLVIVIFFRKRGGGVKEAVFIGFASRAVIFKHLCKRKNIIVFNRAAHYGGRQDCLYSTQFISGKYAHFLCNCCKFLYADLQFIEMDDFSSSPRIFIRYIILHKFLFVSKIIKKILNYL